MLPSMSSPCVTVFKSRQVEMGTKCRCLVLSQRTGRNKWFKELIGGSLGKKLSAGRVWRRENTVDVS